MTELFERGAFELGAQISRGDASSVETLNSHISQVELWNPTVNAVVARSDESAQRRAVEADVAVSDGVVWGPLHGVPITIKDAFEVAGMATTSGSPDLVDHRSETNAVAVQRLIDAGAIVYAKTNLPTFAGDLQSYNDLFGTTSNPWDLHRTAGGSSGGAAAALATGMTPLELGSDIGGSIRNPAALCGVYGHKPTYGLISLRGHIPGPPGTRSRPDLAVAGPLARSPIDIELSMELLAGPDGEAESRAWRYTMPPARHERVEEFRVGVWFDSEICPPEHEVRDHLDSVVDALEAAGVHVDRDARPDISEHASHRIYEQLLYGQMATGVPSSTRQEADARYDDLDAGDQDHRMVVLRGVAQRHRHWMAVSERRHRLRDRWASWFESYDVLLTPVMPTIPLFHDHGPINERTIDIDGAAYDYWVQHFWAGLTGSPLLPSTVVPTGLGGSGLPIGMQVVAPYLEDRTSIRFAELVEPILGSALAPPAPH